ncbi:unnamed protein product [Orchesella dallaii]|uniref:Uncharacterized protein n=1 Tax=Orchesella dallaii TaxID=48710 RepID=A0ABP1Q6U1_9HEXA
MDKSSEGGEADTQQSQGKPQRYSRRLVNLMSGACSVAQSPSTAASASSHEDDIVTHHHKLRSHKRLSSSSSSRNTNNNSRKSASSVSRNPSTESSTRSQTPNQHIENDHHQEGVGEGECEVEILDEKRKGSSKADGRDCCGEQAAGGSDSSLLKSIISSSSCLPPTNETNELSQQAGLGGPTKRCKRTTASASSCSNNNSPLVTVSAPAQKDEGDVDDDEPAAHVACARRASTQLSNDNGCIVETRSDSQSDNEMYQEDDDEVGPSCELPRKPSTSLSTTLTLSSPSSSQLSVGINLLNSAGNNNNNNKNDASEKEKESRVGNNNGDNASFHESASRNYYHHVAEVKIGDCARENTQKKGCGDDGEAVKVKYCNEAHEQRGLQADEGVERRKYTSNAHDEQEDLDVTNAKLQPPMSVIRRVVMPELQIDGGHDDEPLSTVSLTKPKQLPSPSGVHSSKKPSRAKKSQSQQQSHSKASGRRGVVGLSSAHNTIPSSSSSSPSCSSVLLRSKVQLENNSNNNYNTRGGASGFSDNSSSSNSKQSVVEPKKPNIAPMLLMNNLPYMGELTFDTRPRRGRKPKKADICHLISKNYGIQFPVSYINLPNTGTGAQNLPHPSPLPLSQPSTKSSQHKRNNAAASIPSSVPLMSNSVASPSAQMLPPPAFCNRDVSIVPIPSNWRGGSLDKSCSSQQSTSSATSGSMKPLSLAQQLMLHPASAQQAISMFPLPSPKSNQSCQGKSMSIVQVKEEQEDDDTEEEQGGGQQCAENLKMETSSWDSDDTPLNLCLRDTSSMQDTEPLSLCKGARRNVENHDAIEEDEDDEGGNGVGELHSLDVRWNKSVLLHGANATTRNSSSKRLPSSSSAGGMYGGSYGKRNMGGDGSKGCKSAKLSLRTSSHNSFSGSSNNHCGDDVSSLVSQQRLVCPTTSYSLSVHQQQQLNNFAVEQSAKSTSDLRNSSTATAASSSSPIFSITQHLKGSIDSGSISGGPGKISLGGSGSVGVTGGKVGKQGGSSRKSKKEASTSNLRGDVSISVSSLPHHQLPCSNTNASSNTAALSSIGGTLFGQSTSGINDAAEVSICKFKFTGGAKPCLQEKKMLSVDSGGNFRFYTDKTSGGGSKLAKNQQYPSSTSTSCSGSSPLKSHPPSGSDLCHSSEPECHFALSSLPKSAKSMSMCMSVPGSNPAVHVINSSSPSPTPAMPSSSKSRSPSRLSLPLIPSCSNSNPILSISPTTEELQQLRLIDSQSQSNHPRSSSSVSPYHGGEFSYSSSNSCSSDNSNENPMVDGGSTYACEKSSGRLRSSSSCGSGGVHGNKLKMKRKRRTRKSLMREKLEKTFKEKGFLIQTQQLESAEGATYCKFRQLRKFTRYLFRSWKDYLPDHVKEISDNNNGQQQQRIEGLKSPGGISGCSNQTDARCSVTTGEGGVLNLQSIEMDSNDFQDEDGDDDGEDDDLDEDDGDALISDGNDESEEMENGRRLSSSPNKVQKKSVQEEDDEMSAPVLFDSSRDLHSQQHQVPASTSYFPESESNQEENDGHSENTNEGEEELQVDA